MAKKFNPLVKYGFDATLEGCIITPGNIYLPLILDDMDLILIDDTNINDFNYNTDDEPQITLTKKAYYVIMNYNNPLTKINVELENVGDVCFVTNKSNSPIEIDMLFKAIFPSQTGFFGHFAIAAPGGEIYEMTIPVNVFGEDFEPTVIY